MSIIGVNFTKVVAERAKRIAGKIQINNNVGIKSVEKYELSVGDGSAKGIRYTFGYSTEYEPKMGSIKLEGEVLTIEDEATVKKILDEWKANKKVDPKILIQVINAVLNKSNIKALMLSQEVDLPAPIKLPKANAKN